MRLATLLALAAVGIASAQQPKPRANASEYPAHGAAGNAEIGASLLSVEQVRNTFATDLNRGYVVVQVALYPKDGTNVDAGPGDFTLRIAGTDIATRPAAPKAIAAALQRASARDRDIALYPDVGVGYGTGPEYDPVYGGRRGGWSTSGGVGVGIGDRGRSGATQADRKTMETELADNQLPEKIASAPIAGYLYFALETKKKGAAYELEYDTPLGKTVLSLVPPRSK